MKQRFSFGTAHNGSVAFEFALIAPVFFFFVMFIIEVSLINFSAVTIENAVATATRSAKVGVPFDVQEEQIRQAIRDNAYGLIRPERLFVATTLDNRAPPTDAEEISPEKCLSGATFTGRYCPCNPGEFFADKGPPGCNADAAINLGTQGAIVRYAVSYRWDVLTPFIPLSRFYGNEGIQIENAEEGVIVIFSGGAVRNEI